MSCRFAVKQHNVLMHIIAQTVECHSLTLQRHPSVCSPPRTAGRAQWHGYAATGGRQHRQRLHVSCALLAANTGGESFSTYRTLGQHNATYRHCLGTARMPIVGQVHCYRAGDVTLSFLRDPLEFLAEKQRSHEGGVARITLAGKPVLLVWDPALARAVFEGDDSFQKVWLQDHPRGRAVTRCSDLHDAGMLDLQDGTAFLPNSSLAGNGLLVSDGDVSS